MKLIRIGRLILGAAVGMSLLFGCGSGSKDVNGALTVTKAETASDAYVSVDFTIEYTNPTHSDVLGTEITVTTSTGIIIPALNETFMYSTNNSGKTIYTYLLPKVAVAYVFSIAAKTGDLEGSTAVVVPALAVTPAPTFTATPASVTFDATTVPGDIIKVLLAGGTPPYSKLNINPSPNNFISAEIKDGNVLTIVRKSSLSLGDGAASIFLLDSSSPAKTLLVPVTVKGFAPISS
jgi:hypothetical protein